MSALQELNRYGVLATLAETSGAVCLLGRSARRSFAQSGKPLVLKVLLDDFSNFRKRKGLTAIREARAWHGVRLVSLLQ